LTHMTNQPGRAMKTKITKPDWGYYENVTIAGEECSYPFPTSMGVTADNYWRSHVIVYVKALS